MPDKILPLDLFLTKVTQIHSSHADELRYGQCLFNAIYEVRPDLSEQIRATDLDPFHRERDDIKREFWEWLATNW